VVCVPEPSAVTSISRVEQLCCRKNQLWITLRRQQAFFQPSARKHPIKQRIHSEPVSAAWIADCFRAQTSVKYLVPTARTEGKPFGDFERSHPLHLQNINYNFIGLKLFVPLMCKHCARKSFTIPIMMITVVWAKF
jgi:hypothetical protein